MPICIFGESNDIMPVYFARLAKSRSFDVLWLQESNFGEEWSFTFDDQDVALGRLITANRDFGLDEICGAYVNLNPIPALPWQLELPPGELDFALSARRGTIHALIDALPCQVANRSYAGRSNNSKPYQMRLLLQAGFQVPSWIVSNDFKEVAAFVQQLDGNVIAKSCSGLRSRVRQIDEGLLQKLAMGTTPIIAQRLIRGRDVRVHTVGRQAFATEILSNHIDYRFDEGWKKYRPILLPSQIESLCYQFAEQEAMVIAGFDFKVTDDEQWYCLEMNPVPTFLPYEMETGQRIGDALLDIFTR